MAVNQTRPTAVRASAQFLQAEPTKAISALAWITAITTADVWATITTAAIRAPTPIHLRRRARHHGIGPQPAIPFRRTGHTTVLPVSYTHLRAHETGRNLVCRLLLEKKKKKR